MVLSGNVTKQKVEYPHYPSFTKLLNAEPEMSSLRWEVWLNWGAKLKSKTRDFLTDFLTRHQGRCFEGVNQCVCISRDIELWVSCNHNMIL